MTLSLIVKGTRFEAARAAADRGIPFAFRREVRSGGETIGRTGSRNRDRVAAWFAESPRYAPFPVGTLLLYSEVKL